MTAQLQPIIDGKAVCSQSFIFLFVESCLFYSNVCIRTEFWQSCPRKKEPLTLKQWRRRCVDYLRETMPGHRCAAEGKHSPLGHLLEHVTWSGALVQIASSYFAAESRAEYVPKWHIFPFPMRLGGRGALQLNKVQQLAYLLCIWHVMRVWGRGKCRREGGSTRWGQRCCGERRSRCCGVTKD